MRIALLFVLLINTVCGDSDDVDGDSDDVDGCIRGWFEFQCRGNGQNLEVSAPQGKKIIGKNITANEWSEEEQHLSLYHNTTEEYWRVHVKQLNKTDFGEYECKNGLKWKIELQDDDHICSEQSQKAYVGASTTIVCTRSNATFICKESSHMCNILLRDTNTTPVYHISNVTLQDGGVYWCGYEPQSEYYKVSKEKIHLQVAAIEVTMKSLNSGQDLTHQCKYPSISGPATKKLVCKGEDTKTCTPIFSTTNESNGSFTLKHDRTRKAITLTIQNVTVADSGSYWYGTEKIAIAKEKEFFHKLELTVAQMTTSPSPTHPDMFWKPIIIAAVVSVGVLLLALIAFVIHRRVTSSAKTTQAQNEEHCYEEIQEHPLQITSGTALKTV